MSAPANDPPAPPTGSVNEKAADQANTGGNSGETKPEGEDVDMAATDKKEPEDTFEDVPESVMSVGPPSSNVQQTLTKD